MFIFHFSIKNRPPSNVLEGRTYNFMCLGQKFDIMLLCVAFFFVLFYYYKSVSKSQGKISKTKLYPLAHWTQKYLFHFFIMSFANAEQLQAPYQYYFGQKNRYSAATMPRDNREIAHNVLISKSATLIEVQFTFCKNTSQFKLFFEMW